MGPIIYESATSCQRFLRFHIVQHLCFLFRRVSSLQNCPFVSFGCYELLYIKDRSGDLWPARDWSKPPAVILHRYERAATERRRWTLYITIRSSLFQGQTDGQMIKNIAYSAIIVAIVIAITTIPLDCYGFTLCLHITQTYYRVIIIIIIHEFHRDASLETTLQGR